MTLQVFVVLVVLSPFRLEYTYKSYLKKKGQEPVSGCKNEIQLPHTITVQRTPSEQERSVLDLP